MTPPLLDFLAEPAFVIGEGGRLASANAAACRLLGRDPVGEHLFAFARDEESDALATFLRRAARSTSPVIGALTLRGATGDRRTRVHAARLAGPPGEPPLVVLRCLPKDEDQFALLSRRVRDLDAQLRQRLQEKAALEESLSRNQTLLDELQHRVKNNIQMMMTLVKMSARGHEGAHPAEIVETARLRLQAMASTQDAIYRSQKPGSVRSGAFLEELLSGIGETSGFPGAIEAQVEDVDLRNDQAHCIALIVNELVTNAFKYAVEDSDGRIRVHFGRSGDDYELIVDDDGPGFPKEPGTRYSGLQLVRGLCRQISGRLDIDSSRGTTCRVSFGTGDARPC